MTGPHHPDIRIRYRVTFHATDSAETFTYTADAHPQRTARTVAVQLWLRHCQLGRPDVDLRNPQIEDLGPIEDEGPPP